MKTKLTILLCLVVAFMLVGCNKIDDPSNSSEPSSAVQSSTSSTTQPSTSSAAPTSADYSIFEEPEDAYTAFLNNLYSGNEDPRNLYGREDWDYYDRHSDNMEFYFALKDLDGDGTPELLIKNNLMNVAVYTFNDNDGLVIVGNRNFMTGTERFLYSNNPSYPGIFYFNVGGGLYHYGYMTVKDKEFIYEELWNEDYSGWRENRIEELSSDQGLIKESKNLYSKGNEIEWTPIQ